MSRQPEAADKPCVDHVSADVLARAEHVVRERQRAMIVRAATLQRPWAWAFTSITLALLLGIVLWPTGTLTSRLHAIVRGVCDQRHTIAMGDLTLPLDARCTGIYSGFLATLIYAVILGRSAAQRLPPRPISLVLGAAIVLMGIDGLNSLLLESGGRHLYPPHSVLRLASGLGCGIAMAGFGLPLFNATFSANRRSAQQLFGSWRELLGAISSAVVLFILLVLGPAAFYYPFALFSVFGIVGVLFLVNLAVVALFSGLRHRVLLLNQLAAPAMLTIAVTGLELTGLAWLRDRTTVILDVARHVL